MVGILHAEEKRPIIPFSSKLNPLEQNMMATWGRKVMTLKKKLTVRLLAKSDLINKPGAGLLIWVVSTSIRSKSLENEEDLRALHTVRKPPNMFVFRCGNAPTTKIFSFG